MERFTASNGTTINSRAAGGYYYGEFDFGINSISAETSDALREMFRAEEDKRLGRWRWPEDPNYVVYPSGVAVRVMHERTGVDVYPVYRDAIAGSQAARAGLAYFAAHPEPEKPWHDARDGEVWRFEAGGERDRHALGWVAHDGTWDLIDPRGRSISGAADPIKALEGGGYDFSSATATKFVPEPSDV